VLYHETVVCDVVQDIRLKMMCCAMMLVSRERIKARPREMYEALYAWIRDVVCCWCLTPSPLPVTSPCATSFELDRSVLTVGR
jgi:hypothetical protein